MPRVTRTRKNTGNNRRQQALRRSSRPSTRAATTASTSPGNHQQHSTNAEPETESLSTLLEMIRTQVRAELEAQSQRASTTASPNPSESAPAHAAACDPAPSTSLPGIYMKSLYNSSIKNLHEGRSCIQVMSKPWYFLYFNGLQDHQGCGYNHRFIYGSYNSGIKCAQASP